MEETEREMYSFADFLREKHAEIDFDPDTASNARWKSLWRRYSQNYLVYCAENDLDHEDVKWEMTGETTSALSVIQLRQLGELLYGSRWQSAMSRALAVNPRTVRRWASGESPVPGPVAAALFALRDARK